MTKKQRSKGLETTGRRAASETLANMIGKKVNLGTPKQVAVLVDAVTADGAWVHRVDGTDRVKAEPVFLPLFLLFGLNRGFGQMGGNWMGGYPGMGAYPGMGGGTGWGYRPGMGAGTGLFGGGAPGMGANGLSPWGAPGYGGFGRPGLGGFGRPGLGGMLGSLFW